MQKCLIFLSQETTFKSYVKLVENNNLINELIIKWQVFDPTLH